MNKVEVANNIVNNQIAELRTRFTQEAMRDVVIQNSYYNHLYRPMVDFCAECRLQEWFVNASFKN